MQIDGLEIHTMGVIIGSKGVFIDTHGPKAMPMADRWEQEDREFAINNG